MPSRRKRKREREAGQSCTQTRPRGDREAQSAGGQGLRAPWAADVESVALIRRAVNEDWPTPRPNGRAILEAVFEAGLNGTPTQSIRACSLMIAIDRHNHNLACERANRR